MTFKYIGKSNPSTHLITPEDHKQLEDLKKSPAFFNNFIDKEHDLRVTVVGERIFAVRIFSQQFTESKVDFRKREGDLKMEICKLPDELTDKIMKLMYHFHLNCQYVMPSPTNSWQTDYRVKYYKTFKSFHQ